MEPHSPHDEFVDLFRQCEHELFAYLYAMVPRREDALDLLQETAIRLWGSFEKYDRQRPFGNWARKFAHTEVYKFYEQQKYRGWMSRPFDETLLELLGAAHAPHTDVLEMRREALRDCIQTLSEAEYTILREYYWNQTPVPDLAAALELSEHSVYRRLRKIRLLLHDCIDRRIAEQQA